MSDVENWLLIIEHTVVIIGGFIGVYRVCQIEKNTRKHIRSENWGTQMSDGDDHQTIEIRFVCHPGFVGWCMRKFQRGFWADHVDAVLPDGRMLGAHIGGVQILPANYDAGMFSKELRVAFPATADQASKFYKFLLDQEGKRYDFLAIVAFAFNRDWSEPNAWFCDELVAAALAECGIFPRHVAMAFNRLTLLDLLLIASGKVEIEGDV